MRLEKKKFEKYKKEIDKFRKTDSGRKTIIIGLICFVAGILWKMVFLTAIVLTASYMAYTIFKKDETKTKA